MSNFLATTPAGGGLSAGSTAPADLQMSDREQALFRKFYLNLLQIPDEFPTWIIDQMVVRGIDIPISQIQGFSGFVAQAASPIATQQGTASTTYVNLATTGPELTGLPDGGYILFFGASALCDTATYRARMALQINATAAADADATLSGGVVNHASADSRAVLKTLANGGNNTVTAKYRSSNAANQAFFENRWLIALKVANP